MTRDTMHNDPTTITSDTLTKHPVLLISWCVCVGGGGWSLALFTRREVNHSAISNRFYPHHVTAFMNMLREPAATPSFINLLRDLSRLEWSYISSRRLASWATPGMPLVLP